MKTLAIIPTWNERENISMLIPAIFKVLPDIDVLVVDDNSPDGTAEVVRSMQDGAKNLCLIVGRGKEGLGKAYIRGFHEVLRTPEFDQIIMMDADFSHDPQYLPDIIRAAQNADVVIGSRYIKDGGVYGWDFWRVLLSRGGNMYCRAILRMPVFDYTGGFNLIKTHLLSSLELEGFGSSGYAFIIELKYRLYRRGARFKEVPIIFKNRRNGESKISNHIIFEGLLAPWKLLFKK